MIFTSASVTRSFRSRTPYCVTNDNIFSAICKERHTPSKKINEISLIIWNLDSITYKHMVLVPMPIDCICKTIFTESILLLLSRVVLKLYYGRHPLSEGLEWLVVRSGERCGYSPSSVPGGSRTNRFGKQVKLVWLTSSSLALATSSWSRHSRNILSPSFTM